MGKDRMRQLLAGLGIASLVAGAGVMGPGPALGTSG
ncbi:hypothetical protein GSUET_20700 [Geobacter sulfurreducens subsp. ethanolicus]|nr:hypothetical protein GSUET_20700 [Geobacter sulfurreducens subsp. ethanolicus]